VSVSLITNKCFVTELIAKFSKPLADKFIFSSNLRFLTEIAFSQAIFDVSKTIFRSFGLISMLPIGLDPKLQSGQVEMGFPTSVFAYLSYCSQMTINEH